MVNFSQLKFSTEAISKLYKFTRKHICFLQTLAVSELIAKMLNSLTTLFLLVLISECSGFDIHGGFAFHGTGEDDFPDIAVPSLLTEFGQHTYSTNSMSIMPVDTVRLDPTEAGEWHPPNNSPATARGISTIRTCPASGPSPSMSGHQYLRTNSATPSLTAATSSLFSYSFSKSMPLTITATPSLHRSAYNITSTNSDRTPSPYDSVRWRTPTNSASRHLFPGASGESTKTRPTSSTPYLNTLLATSDTILQRPIAVVTIIMLSITTLINMGVLS